MNRKDLFEYKDNKEWVENRKARIEEEYENIQKMTATYGDNPRRKFSCSRQIGGKFSNIVR